MSEVSLIDVRKSFGGYEAVRGIGFTAEPGEFVVVVGPSGCGKSTLLRLVCGLEDVTAGEILIAGRRVEGLSPAKRDIAMVFQSYALYPHMTVADNMGFALRMAGVRKSERAERVRRAAATLQIEPLLGRLPRELSGGQRQRVAIGRAIVREPKVFLFDEPLSNLDAELRVQMRLELARLHRTLGATMLYVTHDQVEAMTLADKIVVMRDGLIEQIGSPVTLYDDPDNAFVAGFIGSPRINLLTGTVERHITGGVEVKLTSGGGRLAVTLAGQRPAIGEKVTAGVRPENIELVEPSDEAAIPLRVDSVETLGSTTLVHLKSGSEPVSVEVRARLRLRLDETVRARIRPDQVLLFEAAGKRVR